MRLSPIRTGVNTPSFKAKVQVCLSEYFLSDLGKTPSAAINTSDLAWGLKYLKEMAPLIGNDSDVITLSNTRRFSTGTLDDLRLDFNGEYPQELSILNYATSMKSALNSIFQGLSQDKFKQIKYLYSADIGSNISKIRNYMKDN